MSKIDIEKLSKKGLRQHLAGVLEDIEQEKTDKKMTERIIKARRDRKEIEERLVSMRLRNLKSAIEGIENTLAFVTKVTVFTALMVVWAALGGGA